MKNKLNSFFVLLVLIIGIQSIHAQLGVASYSSNQVFIFWPSGVTNVVLLTGTTNLASSSWGIVSNGTPMTGIVVSNASPAMFFQLNFGPIGMALIPAGSFTMGDTLDGEADAQPINVYVSTFSMETNLVTGGLWQTVYNWATNNGYDFDNVGAYKATNQPVQMMDWYDCVKWCNARSQQAGLVSVYYTDTKLTQIYTNGDPFAEPNPPLGSESINVNWLANGYRLPTEAEWEKAARGGLAGQRFPWGMTISESQANYFGDTNGYSYDLGPYNGLNTNGFISNFPFTTPVGLFAANGYGLNDMAGNVREWCWDGYGNYGQPTTNNPTGPAWTEGGNERVVRGGDFYDDAYYARCARRDVWSLNMASGQIGFRCVRAH